MAICSKEHNDISQSVLWDDVPSNQGGYGRHICAACAYNLGYEHGSNDRNPSISETMPCLPESQRSLWRHKDVSTAYCIGFIKGRKILLNAH